MEFKDELLGFSFDVNPKLPPCEEILEGLSDGNDYIQKLEREDDEDAHNKVNILALNHHPEFIIFVFPKVTN